MKGSISSWVSAFLGWLGRRAPRVRILGLHWVVPLSLLLHATAFATSSTIPIVAHDLPKLHDWYIPSFILGGVATVVWIHTQWRDRTRLPLGLRPGLAWTPIVALLVVAAFLSPAPTATWVAAKRIRELAHEERVEKALSNDGEFYDAIRILVSPGRARCSILGMGWGKNPEESPDRDRSLRAAKWLDVLSGSNDLSGRLSEACEREDDKAIDLLVRTRGRLIVKNRDMFHLVLPELRIRERSRSGADGLYRIPHSPLLHEDYFQLSLLGIACTVYANAATLYGQLSRKQLARRISIALASSLFFVSVIIPIPEHILTFPRTASLVGLGIAIACAIPAFVKGRRSSATDFGLTIFFVGAPWALFLLTRDDMLPWAAETGLLIACAWSVVLSIWLWWLGGRYRTLPFEDGLLARVTGGIEALERISSWGARRCPGLAQLCPVFVVPATLAITALAGITSGESFDAASVPDPEILANTLLAVGSATCALWLALQWRVRAGLPIGVRMGWITGPLPALPVVAMLLAAGPLAGARQANAIATLAEEEEIRDVVALVSDSDTIKNIYETFVSDRASTLNTLPSAHTPATEAIHTMTRLGGLDEHDLQVIFAALSASDTATVNRLIDEKGDRVQSNIERLVNASQLREPRSDLARSYLLLSPIPFWFVDPSALLFLVIVGVILVLLSALAGVVRASDGAVSLATIVVAYAIADVVLDDLSSYFLPEVAVLFSVACAVVVIHLRKKRRTRWTDRSLVVLVLSVPLGIAASDDRITSPSHMNIVYAMTGGWLAAMAIAHRWLAGRYRDLPFEEG